ncbi:UNVERIFIED_CONTAM: hypothetical protein RMT77_007133 [Armadillidium vulgare]
MSLIRKVIIILSFALGVTYANPTCPTLKPGMINVHLVCHTHDDVGWLKTVDQYYYGSRKRITWVGVQYILDSVMQSLLKDQNRKFIYVESAFFFRWWNEQDEKTKSIVQMLVQNGQLEFINGGWSMNDEAAAHYNAIIDQMTLGLLKINETFGEKAFPRIAWQIDPFGHSKEQASLFAQMGMDGLFFGRLDYDDKRERWNKKQMEMVWKGSNSLGEESWLFTGALPNGYSPPKGFCFDLLCPDDPIMDDPRLEDYNKEEMVDTFLSRVEEQRKGYATSNLIMTMGEDFDYVYAEAYYKNLDKLIKYVNARQENGSKVNLVYSTPSCYLDALHDENIQWPTKTDDFFPYASDPHAFWTGYFTSRPTLKGLIRKCNNLLQAIKQVSALLRLNRGEELERLAEAMAVAQHHDAVTGTAKQDVTDDYYKRLSLGMLGTNELLSEGFRKMTQSSNSVPKCTEYVYCPLLNISSCQFTEDQQSFVVNIYNPVSRVISSYVRIPIIKPVNYEILNEKEEKIEYNVIPLPKEVKLIPGRDSKAEYELVFLAKDLPAFGVQQYLVSATNSRRNLRKIKRKYLHSSEDKIITKGDISVTLDGTTNKLKYIEFGRKNGKSGKIEVSQDWMWYAGMAGNNTESIYRASGAYIFRPDGSIKKFSDVGKITAIYDDSLVAEIHQQWTTWVSQVLRIYKDKNYVESEWLVGPIPIEDGIGKEIVNRFHFKNLKTNQTFYTDANGREMQKRVKDFRSTWKLNSTEPVSQNYYPVTSRIIISSSDGKVKAAIMNDRAQGGTSLSDGQMELMVHRRLLYDDAFGVGEALNETAFGEALVVRGRHLLLHSNFASDECDFGCQHRTLGEELLLQPVITFSCSSSFSKDNKNKMNLSLSNTLPLNIRILTLEPWREGEILLRLENYYEKGESSLSGTTSVNIKETFAIWPIKDIEELTLGANKLIKDNKRLKWKTRDDDVTFMERERNSYTLLKDATKNNPDIFTFSPMQIRTFVLKF